jgi:hypothetical protein
MPLLPRKNNLDYNANSIISAGKQVSSKALKNMALNADEDYKNTFSNITDVKDAKEAMEIFVDNMGQIADIFRLMKSTGQTLVSLRTRGAGRTKGAKNKPKIPKTAEQLQEEAIRKSTYSQPSGLLSMMMSAEPNTRFTPQTVQQYRDRVVSEGAVARGTPVLSGQEAIAVQGKRPKRPKVPKQPKVIILPESESDKSSAVSESDVLRRRRSRSRSQQGIGQVQQIISDIERRSGGAPAGSPPGSPEGSPPGSPPGSVASSNTRTIRSPTPSVIQDDDDISSLGNETSQLDYEEYDGDAGDGDIGARLISRSPQDRIVGLILRGTQILRRLNTLVNSKIRKEIKRLSTDDLEELKDGFAILRDRWDEIRFPRGTDVDVFDVIARSVAFADEMIVVMDIERKKLMNNILVVINSYKQNEPAERPTLMPDDPIEPAVGAGGSRFRDEGFRRTGYIPNIYGRFINCPTKYLL